MTPPNSEWMLWAKRFQIEHARLLSRVKDTEELTVRLTSLQEDTKDLAASSRHLQEQNNVLKERIHQLEEDAVNRELANEEQSERLEAKITSLENTLIHLAKREERWMEGVDVRCDGVEKEVKGLKARIEKPRAFVRASSPREAGSPRPSLATTADDSMHMGENSRAKPDDISVTDIRTLAQGEEALEAYVRYSKSFLAREIQQYDIRAAKAFISGIRSKYYRVTLWEKLEELGWSTVNATNEAYRMIEDGKRRKKRRERLLQQLR